MRLLFISLFFFVALSSTASTYYFSSTTGDDSRTAEQAQHAGTPWKTLYKLNAYFSNLRPGDSILFQRGSVFTGPLRVTQSGTSGQPIVFSAYGNGNSPIITGFAQLSGWTSAGKGIWRAACPACGPGVNMLTISGQAVPMGRTPNPGEANEGYFTIQSHVKNQAISDDHLQQGPDWTGAEAVIRKNRFIIDRNKIISQSGNTLQLKGGSFYEATDQFGYFIQNDIRTLDRKGEWYYDPGAKTMNLYYGSDAPSGTVMASSVDTLVVIKNQNYLTFKGLSFQGSNLDAFNVTGATGVTITGCGFSFSGLNAIKALKVADMVVDNTSIRYSNSNSIDITGTHNSIRDNKVSSSGTIPGMGAPEQSYVGIFVSGTGNTIQYNEVDTTGYVGIFFLGGNNTIKNNSVDYFNCVKDDGGGIYTWSGNTDTIAEREQGTIAGNIILNGITAPAGTDKKQVGIAYGIYLDENSSRMDITGNTVSRCTGGIFLQDAHEVTVKDNTLYDNGFQISLRHPLAKGTLRNNKITNNIAAAKTDDQNVLVLSSAVSGDVTPYADFDGNKYVQPPTARGTFFKVVTKPGGGNAIQSKGNLDQWKASFGKDQSSVAVPPGQPLFEYNKTKATKTITLNGTCTDLSGHTYQGTLELPPYSSVLLFKK